MKKPNNPFRPLNEVHSKTKKQPEKVAPGFYDHSKHGRQLGGARHDGERKEKDNSRIEYARSLHLPTRTVLIQF